MPACAAKKNVNRKILFKNFFKIYPPVEGSFTKNDIDTPYSRAKIKSMNYFFHYKKL